MRAFLEVVRDEAQGLGGRDLVQSCSFNEWRN